MKTYIIVGNFIMNERTEVINYLKSNAEVFSNTDISNVWLVKSDKDVHNLRDSIMDFLTGGNFIVSEIKNYKDTTDGMMSLKFWELLK